MSIRFSERFVLETNGSNKVNAGNWRGGSDLFENFLKQNEDALFLYNRIMKETGISR